MIAYMVDRMSTCCIPKLFVGHWAFPSRVPTRPELLGRVEKFGGLRIALAARRQRCGAEVSRHVRVEGRDDIDDQPPARNDVRRLGPAGQVVRRVVGGGHRCDEADIGHLRCERRTEDQRVNGMEWTGIRIGHQCGMIGKEHRVEQTPMGEFCQALVVAGS